MYQHSPLRIGAVGTHVVGFLSKGLLRKAKPLVIFPGCGTRIEARVGSLSANFFSQRAFENQLFVCMKVFKVELCYAF